MNKLLAPDTDLVRFIADILLENGAAPGVEKLRAPSNGESTVGPQGGGGTRGRGSALNWEHLAENIVVFPGKRPSHFLRKYIADIIKVSFRPPAIFSMDRFIDFAYERLFAPPDRKIESMDAANILYTIPGVASKYGNGGPWDLPLDKFLPWATKIFSDFEEMHIEKVSPSSLQKIEAIAQERLPEGIQKRLVYLSRIYSAFYDYLRSSGFSTRSTRYRSIAEKISELDTAEYKSILFAGFFVFTRSEQDILRELKKRKNVGFIFQNGHGIDETIRDLGIEIEREEARVHKPKVYFHRCVDTHSEVFALSDTLGARDEFSEKDVIVAPLPETVFPVVEHALPNLETEYNISMGYPLSRTPIFALIQALGKALETRTPDGRYFVPSYLSLVLHPYIKNIRFDGASYPTRIVFHSIEEYLGKKNMRFIKLEEVERGTQVIRDCVVKLVKSGLSGVSEEKTAEHIERIHTIFFRSFDAIENIGDFCEKVLACVSFVSENSSANRHPYSAQFLRIMIEGLHELKLSGIAGEKMDNVLGYFKLLSVHIGSLKYPFEGTPVEGLQVLGLLETRNLKFDTVYFLDANEGVIPDTRKEDTILPYALRRNLGLPTHEERERISRYYFDLLTSAAEEVHIFYIEAAEKEKSRFVERLAWEEQKVAGTVADVPDLKDIFFGVDFSQTDPAPVKKTAEMLNVIRGLRFSASSLDTYLYCPLQFYYERILRLGEKDKISGEVEPKEVGSRVHEVLSRFFSKRTARPLVIRPDDEEEMKNLVDEVWNDSYGTGANEGLLYLIKLQVKRRVKDVLEFHSQRYKKTVIIECEDRGRDSVRGKHRGVIEIPGAGDVKVLGWFDRVDKRGDEIVIVDYKTGKDARIPKSAKFTGSPREKWTKTLVSVQLPFYVLLYFINNPNFPLHRVNSSQILLGGNPIDEKLLFDEETEGEARKEIFQIYREAILRLVGEILDPGTDFIPTSDPQKVCPDCAYTVLCGTQWITRGDW
ncbi:MAG: PD-(D/E)XK nuclease family protein [Candidatus Eisenbacteria bacterium]|nr:PD-(D/E)XK nuclease family protein [Candidatus Eisenbacteria bacterium]